MLAASANNQIDVIGFSQLHSDFLIHLAVWHLSVKRSRSSVGDVARNHDTRLLAFQLQSIQYRHHGNAVGIHTNHSVVGLVVAGQSCSSSRRVGDVVTGRMGIHHTNIGEFRKGHLLARGQHSGIHLRQTHSVANHINDIDGFGRLFLLLLSTSRHRAQEKEGD